LSSVSVEGGAAANTSWQSLMEGLYLCFDLFYFKEHLHWFYFYQTFKKKCIK
jgi:hypothetical protein